MGEGERGRWGRGRARVRHSGTARPPAAGTRARDEGNRKGGNVGFHDPQNNIICPCGKKQFATRISGANGHKTIAKP